MKKAGRLIFLIFMVGLAYIMMMLFQPAINNMVETANASVNSTAHASFAYAQAVVHGWPFWSYLIPAAIGMVAGVAIIKGED